MDIEQFARSFFTVVTDGSEEWDCLCPWHGDKSPSLRVNVKKGLYFCHGCHKKGTLERLAKDKGEQITAPDISTILEEMVERLHAPEHRDRRYNESMLAQFSGSYDYWEKVRGIRMDTIRRFKLGQDEIERAAIVPMRNFDGELIGIIKRRFGNVRPKYLYPPGMKKSDHLFGSWMLEEEHTTVAIVEGSIDALAMWDVGIPALAILGSRMSDSQVSLLNRLGILRVVIFTDNDDAGTAALRQIIEALPSTIMWSVAVYEDGWGSDPASLKRHQRKRAFNNAISQFDLTV